MLEPALALRPRARAGAVLLTVAASVGGLVLAGGGSTAAAAPAGRPGASAVSASTAGSTAIRLDWRNPAASGRVATVVRYAAGPHAPRTPTAGHGAGRPGRTRTTLTVERLRPATRYSFALFTAYGHGRYGTRAVVHAMTPPDAVRAVQPFFGGHAVTITWRAPRAATYAATVVRYAAGGRAPASPHEGTGLALAGTHATSARLSGLPAAASYAVSIWTRDRRGRYSSIATTRFTTPAAASTPTGQLAGTVTDDAAHPLAGADVLVVDSDTSATWSTTTDGSGHYALTVPAGGMTVVLAGPDATGGDGDAAGYQADVQDVLVPAGATETVSGALKPGGELDGQATDVHGDPLAGVGIFLDQPDAYVSNGISFSFTDETGGLPTTGPDGRFRLRGVPPVAEQVCYEPDAQPVTGGTNDAAGYVQRCEHRTVAVGAGATRTLAAAALLPAATGVVTGVVTDAAGHPVAGVIVDITAHDPEGFGAGGETTDATGHYRVGGLPPGRYDVCADPTAVPLPPTSLGSAITCRFAAATVTRGHVAVTDVSLRAAGGLGGRVRGPGGTALVGALAVVQSQGGPTAGYAVADHHGQYVVRNLAPGRYRVCFLGASTAPGGVQPGCHGDGDLVQVRRGVIRIGVDATLLPGGAVRGHVSGVPSGSSVFVAASVPGAEESSGATVADSSGDYELSGLPAGRFQICSAVFPPVGNDQTCHRGLVAVRVGHVTTGVNLALASGGSVTATVTNEGGHPVSGVDVTVVASCPDGDCGTLPLFDAHDPTRLVASDMTDAQGRVRLPVAPSAHYAVCAFTYYGAATAGDPATGYRDACTSHASFGVTVSRNHDTPVAFTLHPAGAISGRVTDRAGHALAGVRVVVSGSSSSDYYDPEAFGQVGDGSDFAPPGPASDVTTDADGTYVVPGVDPGGRTVCFDPGGAVDVTGASHPHGILGQCVGGSPGAPTGGTPVTVTAGSTSTGIDQALADAAVITGRVVDRVSGWPVRNATAVVFSGSQVLAVDDTNGAGLYRLVGIPPGSVKVCFVADRYRAQCYDGVAWAGRDVPANAKAVVTTAGGTVTLKDARLRRE